MLYTIKDLTEGRVAVKNDGTLEELRKVLNAAFPNNPQIAVGNVAFYRRNNPTNFWIGNTGTTLPIQSVKDFLEPEFKYGEEVEVRDTEKDPWTRALYVAHNPIKNVIYSIITVTPIGNTILYKQIRKIEQPKILELTLEEIATKFGVSVKEIKIKK